MEPYFCDTCGKPVVNPPYCSMECSIADSGPLWGPEDGGCCPCGGISCDGTCGANTPFNYEEVWLPPEPELDEAIAVVLSQEEDDVPF